MFSFLLSAETEEVATAQSGVPTAVWVIVGIIAAIILLVMAIKSFWVSKIIAILCSIAGIILSIITLTDIEFSLVGAILGGVLFSIMYIFLMGNAIFDSETEGDYLILGTLVHDTNHPFKAFWGYLGGIVCLAVLIFWASYAWTFIIGLVAFILSLLLSIGMIIERVRD